MNQTLDHESYREAYMSHTTNEPITIDVIAPSRPNSKFLAHFVLGFLNKTSDVINTKLYIMPSASDEWNKDLFAYFGEKIKFIPENHELGQKGHHIYLNELLKETTADWVLALCDDMGIETQGWDDLLRDFIRFKKLNPENVYQLIPGFIPGGAVEHILSRGFIKALGHWSQYPNTDTYLNSLVDKLPEEIKQKIRLDVNIPMFKDYSRDLLFIKLMNTDLPRDGRQITEPNPLAHMGERLSEDVVKLLNAFNDGEKI